MHALQSNPSNPVLPAPLDTSNPELAQMFGTFLEMDVIPETSLDDVTRHLVVLAACVGCQGVGEFRALLPAALDAGVTPVQARELVYQSVAYQGMARTLPFVSAADDVFSSRKIDLPLASQATTTPETRREAGTQAQVDIFGEGMRDFWQSGPELTRHVNRWLAANCFGDYYTRGGLDNKQRELVTLCLLAAQGGCEPQLISHARANMRIGNDKAMLVDVVSQCLPYIGYPRSLNALRCVEEAAGYDDAESETSGPAHAAVEDEDEADKGVDAGADAGAGAGAGSGSPATFEDLFPRGVENPYGEFFIGKSYLQPLCTEGVSISNVTFEPRCRNNWHIHHATSGGGQILLCTSGRGWYQELGKPARKLLPGDVVVIPAEVKHWHGAAADSWFAHVALATPGEACSNEWCEPVSDEEYDALA